MSNNLTESNGIAHPSECDLVMKGGITSGIVYPPLFDVLHKNGYRFRNVGGTSAGAIAAAVTAAAQVGGESGFAKLREVTKWLGEDKNLLHLFKATGKTKPLFKTFLAYMEHTLFGITVLRAFVALAIGDPLLFILGGLFGALVAFLSARLIHGYLYDLLSTFTLASLWFYFTLIFWIIVGAVIFSVAHIYLILTRVMPKTNFFGMCTGRSGNPRKFDPTVLTDWLNTHINDLAGKDTDPEAAPLTFGDLWRFPPERNPERPDERNIDLRMVTSNLSQNQPYVLPFENSTFIFKEADFRRLFPKGVINHLKDPRVQPTAQGFRLPKGFYFLPAAKDLPVIVATRMSLSFPVLLGMVPLYTISRGASPEEMRFEIEDGDQNRPANIVCKRMVVRKWINQQWAEVEEEEMLKVVKIEKARKILNLARKFADTDKEEANRLVKEAREEVGEEEFARLAKGEMAEPEQMRIDWEALTEDRAVELKPHHMQINWFSDGGICSNFPIQFFDAWLPKRPTFGVNLTSQLSKVVTDGEGDGRKAGRETVRRKAETEAVRRNSAYVIQPKSGYGERSLELPDKNVFLPGPDSVLAPQWIDIDGIGPFFENIFNTAQNYRDNMLAMLPSYRERIVQIRLSDEEGGLNLNMPPEVIEKIFHRGQDAGTVLLTDFNFAQHQWVRFRVLMKEMEDSLVKMNQVVREHQIYLAIANKEFNSSTYPYSPSNADVWLPEIARRLQDIGMVIQKFNPDNLFSEAPTPVPQPHLRVTPDI